MGGAVGPPVCVGGGGGRRRWWEKRLEEVCRCQGFKNGEISQGARLPGGFWLGAQGGAAQQGGGSSKNNPGSDWVGEVGEGGWVCW